MKDQLLGRRRTKGRRNQERQSLDFPPSLELTTPGHAGLTTGRRARVEPETPLEACEGRITRDPTW